MNMKEVIRSQFKTKKDKLGLLHQEVFSASNLRPRTIPKRKGQLVEAFVAASTRSVKENLLRTKRS